jgi:cytoskeletal protein CcmA (bactofilin family)
MDNKNPGNTGNSEVEDSALGAEGESLEFGSAQSKATIVSPETSLENTSETGPGNNDNSDGSKSFGSPTPEPDQSPLPPKKTTFWDRFNVYLLLFILIIVISVVTLIVMYIKNHNNKTTTSSPGSITEQQLSSDALQQLASNGVQVGDPKQVLSIQSNSVFAGTVLVKGELQVAGGLKIGSGSLNVPDISIGGTAVINQLQAKSLAVAGNAAVQGQLTVQQNLSVNGNGAFTGTVSTPQLTAGKLQISGDLAITRHLVAGGSIPNRTNGSLGNGGTSSLSGSDTAGSVSINTGSNTTPGCMVTVTFAQGFSSTPHISLTPVGSAAGGLAYYVNRTTSNFSICTNSTPPANQTFGFDYIALD